MAKIFITTLCSLLLACGQETEQTKRDEPKGKVRRFQGETLIIQEGEGPTPLGVRLEALDPSPGTPSVLNLAVSSRRLPLAGFGALACFQGTDYPQERTQVCMGFRHSEDVTADTSQPELFFFRIERVEGRDQPHVMFSAGKEGLTVYEDNGAWWSGEVWDRNGRAIQKDHFLNPVARIGSDGIIRAKAFEKVETIEGQKK